MSLALNLRTRALERRRHQRVRVVLLGRFMLENHQEYPCQSMNISPGGIAMALGLPAPVPALLPTAILLAGSLLAAVLPTRGYPAAGFAVAVLAWTFGSPVVNPNTPALLLALLAPVAWPWAGERQSGQAAATHRALA